jgi:hypothetical protein
MERQLKGEKMLQEQIKMERIFQMPNSKTFQIPVVKKLIEEEMLVGPVCDPFPFPYEFDALGFMKNLDPESQLTGLYDPPYSQRQLREMYDSLGLHYQMNSSYWGMIEREWFRIIMPGGKVIRFGWNSKRMKGFDITRILLINHGGQHNDTIVTVQQKNQCGLF